MTKREFKSTAVTSASITREIFLLLPELTERRGDVGGCENRRRHLVEQRLKDVVIAAIDQMDFRIGIVAARAPRRSRQSRRR